MATKIVNKVVNSIILTTEAAKEILLLLTLGSTGLINENNNRTNDVKILEFEKLLGNSEKVKE